MNVILIGPPGAGKGTQANRLVQELGLTQISTGDLFRKAIKENNAYGVIAQYFTRFGYLVPDDFTIQMVSDYFTENPDVIKTGFILDGFPRTINQAMKLEDMSKRFGFKIDAVINLDIPQDKLIERLSGRRTCLECGSSYHIIFNKPKKEGICDKCGGELIQREDETKEAVAVRLDIYDQSTRPLIDYYKMKGQLKQINGDQSMDDVFKDIKKCLDK